MEDKQTTILGTPPSTTSGDNKETPSINPPAATPDNTPADKPSETPPATSPDPSNEKKEEVKKDVVPEKYEPFKLPEGVNLDVKAAESFTVLAKELGLTQEKAQKLVDLQAGLLQEQSKAIDAQFKSTMKNWLEETKKEFGSEFEQKVAIAAKAKDRFGSPDLIKLLNDTGLGNQKEFVRFFIKVGEAISEDKFVDGKAAGGSGKSAAEILFPNLPK